MGAPPDPSSAPSPPSSTLHGASTYVTPAQSSASSVFSNPPSDLDRIFSGIRKVSNSSPSDTASVGDAPSRLSDGGVRRVAAAAAGGAGGAGASGGSSRGSENGQSIIERPDAPLVSTQSAALLGLLHKMAPPHPEYSNNLAPRSPSYQATSLAPTSSAQLRNAQTAPADNASTLLSRLMNIPGSFDLPSQTPPSPTSPPPPLPDLAPVVSHILASDSLANAQVRPPTPYSSAVPASVQAQLAGSLQRSSPLARTSAAASPTSRNGGRKSSPKGAPASTSAATSSAPQAPSPSHSPFAFVSPFDILARGGTTEEPANQSRKPPAPAANDPPADAAKGGSTPSFLDSIFGIGPPPQNSNPASSPPPPSPKTSAPQTPAHPASLHSISTGPEDQTRSPAGRHEPPIDRALLASALLSEDFEQPAWVPTGRSIEGGRGRTITIDVGKDNAEGLDPMIVQVTPITLFNMVSKWEKGTRLGAWERGLVYGTKHGKVRIIDRLTGSKLLLKGQSVAVVDLAIAPASEPFAVDGTESKVRAIASVGRDHKLLVWKAPAEFTSNDPPYHRAVEIQGNVSGEGPRFQLVRFHPLYPSVPVLAVALNDGKVIFVDLASPLLRDSGLSSEIILKDVGTVAHAGGDIIDVAFSNDGTAFAILTADSTCTIRYTEEPCEVVRTHKLPSDATDLSSMVFLSAPDSRPTAIAIASKLGTVIHIVPLGPSPDATDAPAIEFTFAEGAKDDAGANFGHMAYHRPSGTLFVSNSIRGSLFAFRLAFDDARIAILASDADDDVGLFAVLPTEGTLSTPRIDHLTEIATPEPIINFILDDFTSPEDKLSAVCTHPAGVHQITFRHKRAEARSREADGPRRMSLEGSIRVSSEVVVAVEDPAPGDVLVSRPRSISIKREPTVDDIVEEEPEDVKARKAPDTLLAPPESPPSPIKLAGPVVNAAIRSMKGRGSRNASSSDERAVKQESPAASPGLADSASVTNAWAAGNAGGVGKKAGGGGKAESNAEVLRELKKLEESLPARIGKLVTKEMDKQAQRYDEDRAADQAADTTRQETMLKLVSTTLTKNTSKLVETTIKGQIRSQVVPAVGKLVQAAVSEQIARGIAEALTETLPNELERLLYRPQIAQHLAANFSTTIAPHLERHIASAVANTVVPAILTSVSKSVEGVMKVVRQEMVDVRKEIVEQQSGALEFTENEIQTLRADVIDLKVSIAKLERLVVSMAAAVSSPPAMRSPALAAAASPTYATAVPRPVAPQARKSLEHRPPAQYNLPPIPRPTTPVEEYEDMFTNALQPDQEPEFVSLLYLVNSAPPSRLQALFPGPGVRSCISSAVVLSLAFRLAQVLGSKTGPIDDDAKKQLLWLRKCLQAFDDKDSQTAGYTPKIIESVLGSLSVRQKALQRVNDVRGADAVKEIIAYARSRLLLFAPARR